ncbi:hypothetical protein APA_2841 [Pseudanabaena sp. lw0831]|nr:hypothetical protein APA_2841 [Pseudanabaena sp. lw0831]
MEAEVFIEKLFLNRLKFRAEMSFGFVSDCLSRAIGRIGELFLEQICCKS